MACGGGVDGPIQRLLRLPCLRDGYLLLDLHYRLLVGEMEEVGRSRGWRNSLRKSLI